MIALLVPAPGVKRARGKPTGAVWTDIDRLAAEIGAHWPKGVTAAEAVDEVRRTL